LQQSRNNLENLLSAKLERQLELEKSKYEPPVTIRQAEVELEKANRNYKQSLKEYDLRYEKAVSTIRTSMIKLEKEQNDLNRLNKFREQFTVVAPDNGMVIYSRDWNGNRIVEGSMVSPWNMVVAELPDMSTMISRTYVNEVDIRKVVVDQPASISFDAFPDKQMEGIVVSVANVGESLKNSDAKVFKVEIEVKGTDADLRPAMTTGNKIITKKYEETLYLPIETVFAQGDTINYVYIAEKFNSKKQQVIIGDRNSQFVIIKQGVLENDQVRFIPPQDAEEMEINLLDENLALVDDEK
jgi:multidrug efflux pump subunit AcrA (membrane-fusion protein)